MLDIAIRNGQVVDGSGAAPFRADVGVEGGRIVAVGALEGARARIDIEAEGLVVTPGFVDMHSHADFSLPARPTADSLLHQGITTVVAGQCGASPAPLFPGTRAEVIAMLDSKDLPLPWDEWSSFGDYLGYLAREGISPNVVPLVGHGTVRGSVMGLGAEAASDEQMARMQAEVARAMEEGAIGLSTGLIYPPGSYASTRELVGLTRTVGQRGGFYFSHIRNEEARLLEAIGEAISIGRETGAAVQICHFKAAGRANWQKALEGLALIEAARAEGLDVTADVYPYLAGSTGLSAVLPMWAQEGGRESTKRRLADPAERCRMLEDMQAGGFARSVEWDGVRIGNSPRNRAYEGWTVALLAHEAGKQPVDWVFDALLETELDITTVHFGMSEENLQLELQHEAVMIGTDGAGLATDGPLSAGVPHPRYYGAYPRILGRYVRELGILSLEAAVWKMAGFPAQKLRWTDRGVVRRGYLADLVVFDPERVQDQATFEAPHQYPVGIPYVVVNGELVIRDGEHTGARPGRILRS